MANEPMGRLAMRGEGAYWVGYYAMPTTMDGAIEIGRIRLALVEIPSMKATFLETMKMALEAILIANGFPVEAWQDPIPAPTTERSGRA